MYVKEYCIKIDKTLRDKFYHPQGMKWLNKPNIIDYEQLSWLAECEHDLNTFNGRDYVYVYGSNITNLKDYIRYVGEVHEIFLKYEFIDGIVI